MVYIYIYVWFVFHFVGKEFSLCLYLKPPLLELNQKWDFLLY